MKRFAITASLCAGLILGIAAPAGAQTLTPASARFPDTPFRVDSAPIPFTLTNTGPTPLLTNVGTSNTYTSGTFKETNTCPDFLIAGASCAINVVFAPYTLTPAEKSGTLFAGDKTSALSGKGYLKGSGGKTKCKKGKKGASAAKKKKCGKKK